MKVLSTKLKNLEIEAIDKIVELLKEKGEKSKHSTTTVLKIKDENLQYNLEGVRYLTEINETDVFDNNGYSYNIFVLNLEKLCEIVDSLS